jgi:hypothetical protein
MIPFDDIFHAEVIVPQETRKNVFRSIHFNRGKGEIPLLGELTKGFPFPALQKKHPTNTQEY